MTTEPEGTYEPPTDGWVCFHCGERFTTVGAARDHFGATPENTAGCLIDRVALETGTTTERGRGLLMTIRKLEETKRRLEEWIAALEASVAYLNGELSVERTLGTLVCGTGRRSSDVQGPQ